MIYRSIAQLQKKAGGVARVCQVLAVSRSGYYAARRRADLGAKVCPVSVRLQAAFARSGRSYGSRRLQAALRGEGITLGRYRVRRLMRTHGLRATWRRKFIHTTDSRHSLPTAPNVLTCWTGSLSQRPPTRPGCPTSPICARAAAGCTSPP